MCDRVVKTSWIFSIASWLFFPSFYFGPVARMFQISVGCALRFYTVNISTYMNL